MNETLNLPVLPDGYFWEIKHDEPKAKSIEIRKVYLKFWSRKVISTPLEFAEANTLITPADEIYNKASYIHKAFELLTLQT